MDIWSVIIYSYIGPYSATKGEQATDTYNNADKYFLKIMLSEKCFVHEYSTS